MDRTIPPLAASLLDLIASTEGPEGYETIFGNHQRELPKPITRMTIAEVIAAGPGWTARYGSSASGRYQCMRDTLRGLVADPKNGIRATDLYDANCQDRIGLILLRRRGYDRFVAGQISATAFGLALAQEWASFPVLASCRGAHRWVQRGETYYAGDGLNKVGMKPERVEAALARRSPPAAAPPPLIATATSATKPASSGLFAGLLARFRRSS